MILTDPPYNVNYEGGTKDKLKIENDNLTETEFYNFLLDSFRNMFEVAKCGCPIYVFHADTEGLNFRNAFKSVGFKLAECLIWAKNKFVMGRQDYQWQHEPILYGWKEGAAHYFINDRSQSTVFEDSINIDKMKKDELKTMLKQLLNNQNTEAVSVIHEDKPTKNDLHPTMKPIKLCGKLICNSTRAEENVLDLFGGSGSTLIACEQLNRKCYMMEYDPKYVDVIIDRWEQLTGQKAKKIR